MKDNLSRSSNLTFLLGDPVSTIKKIIQTDKKIEAVFVNRDYTPYSIEKRPVNRRNLQIF